VIGLFKLFLKLKIELDLLSISSSRAISQIWSLLEQLNEKRLHNLVPFLITHCSQVNGVGEVALFLVAQGSLKVRGQVEIVDFGLVLEFGDELVDLVHDGVRGGGLAGQYTQQQHLSIGHLGVQCLDYCVNSPCDVNCGVGANVVGS